MEVVLNGLLLEPLLVFRFGVFFLLFLAEDELFQRAEVALDEVERRSDVLVEEAFASMNVREERVGVVNPEFAAWVVEDVG